VLSNYIPDSNERRNTCNYLIGALLCLILTFTFYSVSVIDGAMFGTPEGEIDSIIQDKMKSII